MSVVEEIEFQPSDLADLEPREVAESIIGQAVLLQASDLYLFSDETSVKIAVRNNGRLERMAVLSKEQGRYLVSYFKTMSEVDIAERRRPQEGRWLVDLESGKIDLRLNFIPTLHGEDMTARVLDRKLGLRTLDSLGLPRHNYNQITGLLASPSGLLLVTGPTGTGKTTTLYAAIQHLNNGARKINTIEDPIEFALPGIRQSQVHARLGVDFPELLRNILRQAPDVIMIGEIRDEETAATAVRAGNSGHLVLATLHAPIAAGAIQSLRALGVNPYFLSSCLLGAIAQRLIRRLCQNCRVAYDISESPETFADIRNLLEPGQGDLIFGPGQCEACRGQGYKGRVGVFEVLSVNREVRQMIVQQRPAEDLQKVAIGAGMIEFRRAAMLLVAQGITSSEEVMAELPAEYLGLDE